MAHNQPVENPMALAAVRMLLLAQNPEGLAKAYAAAANWDSTQPTLRRQKANTLVILGEMDSNHGGSLEDESMYKKFTNDVAEKVVVLENVGHWCIFEDIKGTAKAIKDFL